MLSRRYPPLLQALVPHVREIRLIRRPPMQRNMDIVLLAHLRLVLDLHAFTQADQSPRRLHAVIHPTRPCHAHDLQDSDHRQLLRLNEREIRRQRCLRVGGLAFVLCPPFRSNHLRHLNCFDLLLEPRMQLTMPAPHPFPEVHAVEDGALKPDLLKGLCLVFQPRDGDIVHRSFEHFLARTDVFREEAACECDLGEMRSQIA